MTRNISLALIGMMLWGAALADVPDIQDWMHSGGDGSESAWQTSAHFKAKVRCIACHGQGDETNASLVSDTPQRWSQTEAALIQPKKRAEYDSLCRRCHQDAEANFQRTFHGKHASLGKKNIPTCSYCHVGHEPPLASNHNALQSKTLGRVCAGCHGGSTDAQRTPMAFNLAGPDTGATLYGHDRFGMGPVRIGGLINAFYTLLMTTVVGFVLFYIFIDFPLARKERHSPARSGVKEKRFTLGQRLQHLILAASFITLALTGFAIMYADSAYGQWLVSVVGGADNRSLIHRLAAMVFVGNALIHIFYYLFIFRGQRTMMLSRQDLTHAWMDIRFRLGQCEEPEMSGKYDWIQKLEYWAGIIGLNVVLVTGLLMWFFEWTLTHMPYQILKYAQWIHGWEAILATTVVLILHGYSTLLSPRVFPMDWSWITGRK